MPSLRLPVWLFLASLLFRVIDIFILKLDERWGEIILSKSLGLVLVVLFLRAQGRTLADLGLGLGLAGRGVGRALAATAIAFVPVYLVAYGLQFGVLGASGKQPALALAAIDPKTGMTGGLLFALWLVVGNVINACMEEGLFRGVMLPHFAAHMGAWRANLLQAGLFAVWHLVWPVKELLTGGTDLAGAAGQAALLLAATAIGGLVFGSLFLRTGSLWAPVAAHFLHNSVLNLLHIRTAAGLDAETPLAQPLVVVLLLSTIPLTRLLMR